MADQLVIEGAWPDGRGRTRRDVLRGGAIALAGVAALATGLYRSNQHRGPQLVTRGSFDPYVGEQLSLRSSAGTLHTVELFKVRSLRERADAPASDEDESFSLLFRGAVADEFEQDVFELEHRSAPGLAILVVPMRPEPDARFYEAIFNRSRPS